MKNSSLMLVALLALGFQTVCAADAEKKEGGAPAVNKEAKAVRLRFVPKAHEGNGASSTELHVFPEPGGKKEIVQAWSGVGDSFPVREKGGKTIFEVAVTAGDDDRLEIEIRTKGEPQKLAAVRDQRVTFKIEGREYDLVYLSVSGSSAEKTTTDQAMMIVSRER